MLSQQFVFSSLSTVTVRTKFQAKDFSFACVGNVVDILWVAVSAYGNDLEFACVCLYFPMFFKSVDVFDGSLCGEGAVIWVGSVGA